MIPFAIQRMTSARIPTEVGTFQLCYYQNSDDTKEHLALVYGEDFDTRPSLLVRVHSECFTGDVLGSLRCDCGPQLKQAMAMIAAEGAGVIVYMRQEGRGIGLLDKLRAYNLQDEGYDTVDANLMLGHEADERDFTLAALILQDLGVSSLRLLTNNPDKIESLQTAGLNVVERVPLETGLNHENVAYLQTKVTRMQHLLSLNSAEIAPHTNGHPRPYVTLTYAQTLDGAITSERGQPTAISGPESLTMTHQLRSSHDAILVGIDTVLSDDPRLTTRLAGGSQPRPIVVDSTGRLPLSARLWAHPQRVMVATTPQISAERQTVLAEAGAEVLVLPALANGHVDLTALLSQLAARGIASLMVEGGSHILTSFLTARLADRLVVTIAPKLMGGISAVADRLPCPPYPELRHTSLMQWGDDFVLSGDVVWEDATLAS